ncbi:MAG: hypothetical protein Q7S78_00070 [Candidatus Azambacteria bacterium]|nr:hypothetical protein [Candidatus Azambacteria bacterium]
MKIQSMGIRSDRIAIVYENGEQDTLVVCSFPSCSLYHVSDLAICPTIGRSITEEVKRRKEKTERQMRAVRAQANFEKRHLSGWKNKWRDVVFFLGAIGFFVLTYNISLLCGWYAGYSLVFGFLTAFAWCFFWAYKVKKHIKQIKAQAQKIHQCVINGEKIDET